MQSRILGTTMPVLEFALEPNESVISEAGELSWMTSSIQMTTHTQLGGGGGFFGAIKRVAGGGTLFMTEYRAGGMRGELAFATKLPGHIVPVEVTVMAFSAPLRKSRSASDSSSRSAPAFSAATAFCCSASAAWALPGSNSQANSSSKISSLEKLSAFTLDMSALSSPAFPFRSPLCPASRT
jgi:hypothetical protein